MFVEMGGEQEMAVLKRKKKRNMYSDCRDRLCELMVSIPRVREKRKGSREDYMNASKIKRRQRPWEEQEATEKEIDHFCSKAVRHVLFSDR